VSPAVALCALFVAADGASIRVEVETATCARPWIDEARTLRILEVELREERAEMIVARTASCASEGSTFRAAILNGERPPYPVAVPLADVPLEARPRVAALAIAERVREQSQVKKASDHPPPTAAVVLTASTALPEHRSLAVYAAFETEVFLRFGAPLFGAGVGLRVPWSSAWIAEIDASYARTSRDHTLGTVDLQRAGAAIGVQLAHEDERWSVGVGPRLALAYAWTRGHPSDPTVRSGSGSDLVASAALRAFGAWNVADRWWAFAALDGGDVIRGLEARADRTAVIGIDGGFVELRVGLGARL
jgi:hypothetical protein